MTPPDSKTELDRETARLRHDLNNPLTAISGAAELLLMKETGLTDEGRKRLQSILDACARMAARLREGTGASR
jgi:signal transduction histidine kinase